MTVDHADIYRNHADEYDRLVSAEDCDGNLIAAIEEVRPVAGRRILEVGAGTGRITKSLFRAGARVLAFDREPVMLAIARRRLHELAATAERGQWSLACADARAMPVMPSWADLAIAGWVFGHFRLWLPAGWKSAIAAAIAEMDRALAPGGSAIVIETLGTGSESPKPPSEELADYYDWLETENGFHRTWLRTDYEFASTAEGEKLCGFFFGDELAGRIRRDNLARLPECTGLWWRMRANSVA